MISITVFTNEHGMIEHIVSEGHTIDIVCAGVSTLIQTFFCTLYEINNDSVSFSDTDGLYEVFVKTSLIDKTLLYGIQKFLLTGLHLLRVNHKNTIIIINKGV